MKFLIAFQADDQRLIVPSYLEIVTFVVEDFESYPEPRTMKNATTVA